MITPLTVGPADSGAHDLPLVVAMLIMMAGTMVQIVVWGAAFKLLGEFDEIFAGSITRR